MIKNFCFLALLLLQTSLLFSQNFYLKASANYNASINTQPMPEYFVYFITLPTGSGFGGYKVNFNVSEFSIASGFNYQFAAGYSFNDFLSLELKFATFKNIKKSLDPYPEVNYTMNGKTEWNFHHYSFLPTVSFGKSFQKSAINIFLWGGPGINKLKIKANLSRDYREYEFSTCTNFAWGYGIEYLYSFSNRTGLFTNIGMSNIYYNPAKSRVVDSEPVPVENLKISEKEINYVSEIENFQLYYNNLGNPNEPEVRLKEILRLNSLYFGIGLKYSFKK